MSALAKRIKAVENELIQPIQPSKFIHVTLCTYNDDSDIIGYGYEGIKVMRIENESIDDLQDPEFFNKIQAPLDISALDSAGIAPKEPDDQTDDGNSSSASK